MRENLELPAIRDHELRPILEGFHLAEEVDGETLHCPSCNRKINWENIGALLVKQSTLIIYCDRLECIEEVSKEQR